MEKYLIPFIVSFSLAVIFIVLLKFFFRKAALSGRHSERHIHGGKTLRLGGAAIILAFNAAIFLNGDLVISPQLYAIIFSSWIILAVGIWDDVREVSWKVQLFFQTLIAVAVFFSGIRIYAIRNPFSEGTVSLETGVGVVIAFFIALFWIIIMINSMNWLDGIDGLAGGIFFIGAMAMFVLSLRPEVNQPPVAIISLILAGSALGFILFNFHPASIMAGTSGSFFMGFVLAALAIFSGTKVATSILILSLPLIDFIWVIGERLRQKKSIFKADRNHLHHKLLGLGWSQRKIALFFYVITAAFAIIALNARTGWKLAVFLAALLIVTGIMFFMNKKLAKAS